MNTTQIKQYLSTQKFGEDYFKRETIDLVDFLFIFNQFKYTKREIFDSIYTAREELSLHFGMGIGSDDIDSSAAIVDFKEYYGGH